MYHLLRISEVWHDPAPNVRRGGVLIMAVILAEVAAWIIRRSTSIDPILLLGITRSGEAALLLLFGPWTLRGASVRSAALRSLLIALFISAVGLAALAVWVRIPHLPDLGLSRGISPRMGRLSFLFTAALASPVAEELVFRGLFYRFFRIHLSPLPAAGLVSGGFGALHLLFAGRFLVPFAGSVVFCAGYEKEKTILAPIFLHIFGNLIIFLSSDVIM